MSASKLEANIREYQISINT